MQLNIHNLSILILSILLAWPKSVETDCELSNHDKNIKNVCVSDIKCDKDVSNLIEVLNDWSCRRSEYWEYDIYSRRNILRTQLEDSYNINIILSNINSNEDTFRILSSSCATHVVKLEAKNINMINVPTQINQFVHLSDIDMSYNDIETIDLSNFIVLNELRTVNFSKNAISTLAVDSEDSSIRTSGVTSIDLSYNLIETIPNNYFYRYTQLQFLDLSNNLINSFNMITFEGITKLKTLHLSQNKLNSIGYTLTRFVNLIELNLDGNLLSSILEPNFVAMSKLQKLNLSSNFIKHIDNKAFHSLADLVMLDLGYNQIGVITRELLINNRKLLSLSLLHNNLEQIETGAFENKNITEFQIVGSNLMNDIEKSTFQGVYVKSLDLSRGQIKILGPDAFSAMNSIIVSLNLSSNSLHNISRTSFRSLYLLNKLDLSNNNLTNIDLDMSDLKKLTFFFVQNNSIQKIRKDAFSKLTSLTFLDLSCNFINEIELQSFDELKNLEELMLKNNAIVNTVEAHTFQGLISIKTMDIMNTNIRSYENYVFSDTKFLKHFNSSHGQLSFIGFNILKKCDSLEILDFSYNLIEIFDINTTTIAGVKKIYLNNNKLRRVTNETFMGLTALRILHLSNNNIIKLDPKAFHDLYNLMHLYLFSNINMEISESTFNNLTLTDLSLEYDKKDFSFQHTSNASIANLDLQQCGIVTINTVYVFKIQNIEKLNLRSNGIAILDKSSFQNMPYLVWLNLSFNKITYIQPGTFMNTNMINVLNLSGNDIQILQYGVLDGLKNVRELDLTNNVIHSFGVNLLHNSPYITNISLDNNAIQSFNFHDFIASGIKSISIGDNPISCDTFVALKKEKFDHFLITSKNKNFNTENVDGITCRTVFNETNYSTKNSKDKIEPILADLFNSIEKLRVSIDILNRNTELNETLAHEVLTSIMTNFQSYVMLKETIINKSNNSNNNFMNAVDKFIKQSNESQIFTSNYLKQLFDAQNETRTYIETLNEINKNKSINSDVSVYDGKSQCIQFEELLRIIVDKEKDALKNKMNGSIQNEQKSNLRGTDFDKDNFNDVKILLYFISSCLAFILICVVFFILYNSYTDRSRFIPNRIHRSSQPIANVMELE